ncbi:MAG: SpoIIE family protein phosphatase [candidate division KSB1 bacterium]|nr:SpoIIE family protein phosphatase [candidate division KSB1 bacterium]
MRLWLHLAAAVYLTVGFVLSLLGVLAFRQAEAARVGRYAAWTILFAALGAFTAGTELALQAEYGYPPAIFRPLGCVWEFFFPTLLGLSLLYPVEHPLSLRLPRVLPWLYAPYVFHLLVVSFLPAELEVPRGAMEWARGLLAPLRVLGALSTAFLEQLLRFHATSFALVNLVFSMAAVALLAWGYSERVDPRRRQEGRWVLPGLLLALGTYALAFAIPRLVPLPLAPWLRHAFLLLALLFGASAWTWAIIRYQFLGLRLILRRGMVYSLSLGIIAAAYLIAYRQLDRLAVSALGHVAPALHLLFLMLAIFFFQPLVHVLEGAIERLFARELLDAQDLVQRLSEQVLSILECKELENRLRETLEGDLNLGSIYLLVDDPHTAVLRGVSDPERAPGWGGWWRNAIQQSSAPISVGELRRESPVALAFPWPEISEASVVIPIRHRENFLGALIVDPGPERRALPAEEIGLLVSLGRHVATALENARLHRESLERRRVHEELLIAREIQRQLLPATPPRVTGIEVAALSIPSAEVGGDLYDFVELGPDRLGVALGDVAGKGVPASLLMAHIQSAFRVLAARLPSPAQVVAALNRHLIQQTSRDRYATFFFGILDSRAGSFLYCNAGHNYPLVRYPDGAVAVLAHSDVVLGVLDDASYTDHFVQLKPGCSVLLYTDGVTEAFNPRGEEYGDERLRQLVAAWDGHSVQILRDQILEAVQQHSEGTGGFDDITLVVLSLE